MAPKPSIVSSAPDPFEVYNELVRRSRRSWILSLLSASTTIVALGVAFLSFTRPLPVVVAPDDPTKPRRLAEANDAAAREIDAKRFFAATAQRLHGWSSLDVVTRLSEASLLMTTPWRKHFAAEVNGDVAVPASVDASKKLPLLRTYVLAQIRNELDVDWDTLRCERTQAVWHCRGNAQMRIEPLAGPPVDDPKFKKTLEIRASFVEVPVTKNTIDGLLVDFWDAKEKERT